MDHTFSSSTTVSMVAAAYAVAEQQVQFLTDRANRIASTDFFFNFNRQRSANSFPV